MKEFDEATRRQWGITTGRTVYDKMAECCEWWYSNISAAISGREEIDPVFMSEMFGAAPAEFADYEKFAERRRVVMLSALDELVKVPQYASLAPPLSQKIVTEPYQQYVTPWQAGKGNEFKSGARACMGYIFKPDADLEVLRNPGTFVKLCETLESPKAIRHQDTKPEDIIRMTRWYMVGPAKS